MNFYLLQVVGKWISLLVVSTMSLFGYSISFDNAEVANTNMGKNANIQTEVIKHETITTFDESLPRNVSKVLVEGKDGLAFINENGEQQILEPVIHEELHVGTGPYGVYTGIMTGYGPDCKTCSGVGNVACKTVDNKVFNLINDGVYYEDSEYGSVRVLAAALSAFPCGTIVEVDSSNLGKFMGIVLDTGYDMRKNLENGVYHFDVAYETELDEMVPKTTNKQGVTYSVQRWGW